jgi:eukaryotic-like serine/threonine-protein kinase
MTAPVREVDVATLGPLVRIAGGGQGLVYRLRDTPDGPVYKEYLPRVVDDLDVDALRAFVRFAMELDETDRGMLLGLVAWPEVVVRRDGVVRGFLMRQVPAEFRTEMRFAGVPSEELATAQFLLNPPEYLKTVGLRVTQRFRVEFLADTAEALETLHRLDIAVGDLSPNNLLFSLTTHPRCFFVDSDSMRLGDHSVLPQGETPDWRVGDVGDEELATKASDVYKFGLLAARLFAGDQHTTDPSVAPVRLRRHLRRCLAADPDARPRAGDLRLPLTRTLTNLPEDPPVEAEPEPTPRQEQAREPEPEPASAIPRQRPPRAPRPAPVRQNSPTRTIVTAMFFGFLLLIGIGAALSDDTSSSGSLTGGVPAISNLPPEIFSDNFPVPRIPATAYTPFPSIGGYPYPNLIPEVVGPQLVCAVGTSPEVRGGEGLSSARVAIGELCTSTAQAQWPTLGEHAPIGGPNIVGFFGEGTRSPSATVDLTDSADKCWRTRVGFDAGYRVVSVGPLSPCG